MSKKFQLALFTAQQFGIALFYLKATLPILLRTLLALHLLSTAILFSAVLLTLNRLHTLTGCLHNMGTPHRQTPELIQTLLDRCVEKDWLASLIFPLLCVATTYFDGSAATTNTMLCLQLLNACARLLASRCHSNTTHNRSFSLTSLGTSALLLLSLTKLLDSVSSERQITVRQSLQLILTSAISFGSDFFIDSYTTTRPGTH